MLRPQQWPSFFNIYSYCSYLLSQPIKSFEIVESFLNHLLQIILIYFVVHFDISYDRDYALRIKCLFR